MATEEADWQAKALKDELIKRYQAALEIVSELETLGWEVSLRSHRASQIGGKVLHIQAIEIVREVRL